MGFSFDHLITTRIIFRRGALTELGPVSAQLGARPLVITGRRSARDSGLLETALRWLATSGVRDVTTHAVHPEPKSTELDAALKVARTRQCDLVIGLGGGSAIDAAKAIGALACTEAASVRSFVGHTLPDTSPRLPVVAVPTTAGTGSEVTRGAIVTDDQRGLKAGIRGVSVAPIVAIIDPRVLLTAPPSVVHASGFDALCHAVETYVCRRHNPLGDLLSLDACARLGRWLPRLAEDPAELESGADDLALAALFGGLNVSTLGSCLPHRLQQAVGSLSHIHAAHAEGLAAIYPSWLQRAYQFAPARFDTISDAVGIGDIRLEARRLASRLGLPTSLRQIGVRWQDIPVIASKVTGAVENDPTPNVDVALYEEILADAMGDMS